MAENYAKCSLTYEKKHLNAAGSVMGGAIFTLADFTFAVAANITGRLTVSLSSQINYVAPPKGGKITAEAKCVKSGGHTCFFSIVITDAEERTVATVSTTGYIK